MQETESLRQTRGTCPDEEDKKCSAGSAQPGTICEVNSANAQGHSDEVERSSPTSEESLGC